MNNIHGVFRDPSQLLLLIWNFRSNKLTIFNFSMCLPAVNKLYLIQRPTEIHFIATIDGTFEIINSTPENNMYILRCRIDARRNWTINKWLRMPLFASSNTVDWARRAAHTHSHSRMYLDVFKMRSHRLLCHYFAHNSRWNSCFSFFVSCRCLSERQQTQQRSIDNGKTCTIYKTYGKRISSVTTTTNCIAATIMLYV